MKKFTHNLLTLVLVLLGSGWVMAQDEFITTWKTDNPGTSGDTEITIPTAGSGYNYTVDWGDGSSDNNVAGSMTHTYSSAGTYTVSITGDFPRIYFNYAGDRFKLLTIEQWGDIAWSTMYKAFTGCTQLTYNATDAPDLSDVTDIGWMFADCHNFNGNINNWDVSNIQYLDYMFYNAQVFNQSLSSWNTANVIGTRYLFNQAYRFNQDISSWTTSNVVNMSYMFADAIDFNQNIGNWNVSSATNANSMFKGATSFDQDLGDWDISNVQFMTDMFNNAGISPSNYDNTLIGWAALPAVQMNVTLGANGLIYCDGLNSRSKLTTDYNWNITGDEPDCPSFNTTWTVSAPGQTITVPTIGTGYDYYVDWGDGNIDYNITGDASHSYASAGTKIIKIYGDFPRIYFNDAGDKNRIRTIEEWGGIEWKSMENAFKGCAALTINATDAPDLSQATSLSGMFQDARNTNVDLSTWDVSTITSMDNMLDNTFTSYLNYDKTITAWAALPSLQNNVTVGAAGVPFCDEVARDQLTTNNTWNFVADKKGCPFISTWETDVIKRVIIPSIGSGADYKYYVEWGDGDVTSHTTSTNAEHIYATTGNYTIKISGEFAQLDGFTASNHIKTIEQWGDIEWGSMFRAFRGNADLISNASDVPNLSNVGSMSEMFYGCSLFNADLSGWDVSNVIVMERTFEQATSFNGNISNWDVSNVISMRSMFSGASSFNGDISGWDVSNVTDINSMFRYATVFNQNISGWNVSKVTKMNNLFSNTQAFNQDISGWDVSSVTTMAEMFQSATAFNKPLNNWDVTNVTHMQYMFHEATNFNQPIGNWNTSNLVSMFSMFGETSSFNQPINNWDVSNVSDIYSLFYNATAFDQDLGSWDLSGTSDVYEMFNGATSFNQDISEWNVSSITNLNSMFNGATSFNQDLGDWDISSAEYMENMFDNSGMNRGNYDQTLIGWATLPSLQPDVELGASDILYCISDASRTQIISTYNWTFTGDVEDCTNAAPTDITLSGNSIESNNTIGTIVGVFNTADEDLGDSFSYSLVAGAGGDDNASFTIDGNKLLAGEVFDHQVKSQYSIRVQSDDLIDTFEKSFTIEIDIQDVTAPSVVVFSPANNSTEVSINTVLTITYDEELVAGTGAVEIRELAANTLIESIGIADVMINANELSFTLSNTLEFGTEYTIVIPDTFVKDAFDNFSDGINGAWTFITIKNNQTITLADIADKLTTDVAFEVTTSTSSELAVALAITGPATLEGNTVTLDGTEGTVTITANQSGNDAYNAAPEVSTSFEVTVPVVEKQDQTITLTDIADKLTTDPAFEVTASASSELAVALSITGPATLDGTSVTLDGTEGTVTITANQSGNDDFNAAPEVSTSFEVTISAKEDQTITLAEIDDKLTTDAAFEVTTSASSELAVALSITGPATLEGTTVTLDGTEGTVTITANQAGNEDFNPAVEVSTSFEVIAPTPEAQTITFAAIEDQFLEAGSLVLSATASSGLSVSYEVVSGPATVSGSTVSFTDLGTVVVKASQTGDDSFLAAEAVEQSFEVITVTSRTTFDQVEINAYPNPVIDKLYITANGKAISQVQLLDLSGKLMASQGATGSLDVSRLQAGQYILRISTGDEVIIKKIIKQ